MIKARSLSDEQLIQLIRGVQPPGREETFDQARVESERLAKRILAF